MINYFISKILIINIWNNTFNSFLLPNLYKVGAVCIIYYIIYLINHYDHNIVKIDNIYLTFITLITLVLKLYRAYISYNKYRKIYKKIYNIYNNLNKIFNLFLIINNKNDEIEDIEEKYEIEDIDDSDEIDGRYENAGLEMNNSKYTINKISNNNYDKNSISISFKNLILLYGTYFFIVCKTYHGNYLELSNLACEDYKKYDISIKEYIMKIYYYCNINNYQFKINNIEYNIYDMLYTLNKKYFYSIDEIKIYLQKIHKDMTYIFFHLNHLKTHNVLYNYFTDLLILINLISICIYFIDILPNIGIVYVIIITYIYVYIHFLHNLYSNCFFSTKYGIELNNLLYNLYDELYIMQELHKNNIKYYYI
jgi:hypothetical protein